MTPSADPQDTPDLAALLRQALRLSLEDRHRLHRVLGTLLEASPAPSSVGAIASRHAGGAGERIVPDAADDMARQDRQRREMLRDRPALALREALRESARQRPARFALAVGGAALAVFTGGGTLLRWLF